MVVQLAWLTFCQCESEVAHHVFTRILVPGIPNFYFDNAILFFFRRLSGNLKNQCRPTIQELGQESGMSTLLSKSSHQVLNNKSRAELTLSP
jgi:hypothetical protein